MEAHDNYNLYDLLQTLHPNEEVAGLVKRSELAGHEPALPGYDPLCQLGQEFMRTKLVATGPDGEITLWIVRGHEFYNAPDFVNQVQLGSGQSKQGINCLYPKLDQFEDKSFLS